MSAWNEIVGQRLAAKQELALLASRHSEMGCRCQQGDMCAAVKRAVEVCLCYGCTWAELRMVWAAERLAES
jgi:hypothetical protein